MQAEIDALREALRWALLVLEGRGVVDRMETDAAWMERYDAARRLALGRPDV